LPTAEQMKAAKTDPLSTLQLADPLGYLLVDSGLLKPGTEITEGTWFVFKPKITASGGDFISDFTSTLGGLGSAFSGLVTASAGLAGSFVDYMQQLSEQVKSSLAKAVVDLASQLPLVTESCALLEKATGDSCEELVKQGIEYGLVSMGVPPSLPSWEELKEQGAQYLAAQVASAIGDPTGLAEEFTHDQLLAMVDHTTDKQTESRGGDDPRYDWVVPYLGFEPAIWTLSLKKNTEDNLPEGLFLRIKPTALFEGLSVLVPSKFPEGSTLLTIPVVLPPNTKGIPAPRCTAAPLGEVSCQPDPSLAEPLCIGQYLDTNGTHSVALPCGAVNYPGIYYRDAWLQQRYFTTSCAPLSAVSFTKTGPLWLLFEPPFIAGAALAPQISATWDGAFFGNCP